MCIYLRLASDYVHSVVEAIVDYVVMCVPVFYFIYASTIWLFKCT